MSDIEQIGAGNPDGLRLGVTGGKVALYGATPAIQAVTIAALTTTGSITQTGAPAYCYATAAQADGIVSKVNSIIAALKSFGLIASA